MEQQTQQTQPETQAQSTPVRRGGGAGRAWRAVYGVRVSTVVWLLAFSLGFGMVGVQVSSLPVLVVFAVVWGVTVIALFGLACRLAGIGSPKARHRRQPA